MNRRRQGRPTLADVAKKAGVSVMTVSNVVNGRLELVREETRARVTRAIQQLGYRPHIHARALRLARGWAIGMLVVTRKTDFVTMQWMSSLVAGLTNHLNEHGYGLLLHNQTPDALDRSVLIKRAHTDGVIAMLSGSTQQRAAVRKKLLELGQPLIFLQEKIVPKPDEDVAIVRHDDFGAGALLAKHITGLGARSLVFVEPDFGWPAMLERIRGISSVVETVPARSLRVIKCEDTHERVEAAIRGELKENGLPDAFVGGNELIALATLTTLESAGYRIPEDVLLAGFNAFQLWLFAKRKLTTINFPAYEMGLRTARLMLDRLNNGRFASHLEVVPGQLIVGDTTYKKPNGSAEADKASSLSPANAP